MNLDFVEESFYLSEDGNLERLVELTNLAEDEILSLVGRFRKDHWRFAGKIKGEVLVGFDGTIKIRHHFTKKILWSNE